MRADTRSSHDLQSSSHFGYDGFLGFHGAREPRAYLWVYMHHGKPLWVYFVTRCASQRDKSLTVLPLGAQKSLKFTSHNSEPVYYKKPQELEGSLIRQICATLSSTAIMGFFGDVISEVVGNSIDGGNDAPSDPPYVHPPWVARWDGEAGRWIYFNEETGERSWERPVLEEAGESWHLNIALLICPCHAAKLTF